MDFGIFIPPLADSWKLVQRAEALGYTRAWFYDTQMLNSELFVAMTAAALKTSRIRIASGVMIPSNRIAPVAASGLATLNALAPGRIDWGLSTGSTARSTMGLARVKQADMEEYIRVVQGLLSGETLEWNFEGRTRKIRFLDPDIGAVNIREPIPLHISAFGPRGRKLIARLGAGWIDAVGSIERARGNFADILAAWREAGREASSFKATAAIQGCVLKDGEPLDSPRVKSIIGAHAMTIFHRISEMQSGVPPLAPALAPLAESYRRLWEGYAPEDARYLVNHRGHRMYLRPEEVELCTAELIRSTTVTASRAELRDRLRALADAGFAHVGFEVGYRHPEVLEDWMDVIEGL